MIESIVCNATGKDPMYKTWHTSNTHLIMYIHTGQGSVVCADKLYPLEPGLLVYIAADTYHYTMPDDPACYVRSKLFLNPSKLEKLLPLHSQVTEKALVCARIPVQERKAVEAVFSRLTQLQGAQDHRLLLAAADVLQLMYWFAQYWVESTAAPTGFIGRTIAYIGENIAWDMDLDSIYKAVNVSKFHLCRSFREHTGMTVMDYILSTRIILAKNELKKTDLSVMQISEKCGFNSVSNFCRVFRKKEGCTPLQYRKRYS